MARSAVFGKYWPADSVVHRLDPRTKLGCLVLAMAAIFAASGPIPLAVAALFVLAFLAASRIPPAQALRSIAPLAFIVVLTALLNIFFVQGGQVYWSLGPLIVSQQGVDAALFLSARLLLLLVVASLVTLTTTTLDITDAFESVLSPFKRLGLPAHEFSMILGIALRFLPQFVDESRTVRAAQMARGAHAAGSVRGWMQNMTSLIVPLFTSAFRHAETLSSGMDARCYHGGEGRTRLNPLRFEARDATAALAVLAMLACVVAAGNLG